MARKKKITDPFSEREAQKYERPVPSRELIMQWLEERGEPARREEIAEKLAVEDPELQEALNRRLRAMERDGQLVLTRRGGYGLAEKMDLVRGRVIGHREGYGFVVPDDGSTDLFLSAHQMRAAFHGDKVLVRVAGIDRRGRREGSIVEVLERAATHLVGRFFLESGVGYMVPDNKRIKQDILIPQDQFGDAKPGQIVQVEIITPPTIRTRAIGKVTEVMGEHMAPGMEIDIAIRTHNIPYIWPEAVSQEVADLKEEVTEKDKKGRIDLRDLAFVTIDGEDAKDFDDAVYATRNKKGWILFVAIADVSHYVKPNTALDAEAIQRGNSVYFPGHVVPMLPEILSNGLCSLKPNVDRLAMVCEMHLNAKGKTVDFQFYRSVINSKARLTYTQVSGWLNNPDSAKKNEKQFIPHLRNLHQLYEVLRESRDLRGAIDFDTTETKIIFGAGRKIEKIIPFVRNEAHKIIEECMLMANVTTAQFLLEKKIPSLFRVHEGPTPEKLQDLRNFLGELGLRLPGRKLPKPTDYAELIRSVGQRPDSRLIQTVMLRSLSQAVYSPENTGHFGLAYSSYTHFTSPIRRYPDLIVHRAIAKILSKGKEAYPYEKNTMVSLGDHTSVTERRADEATRDTMDWLKCEFISDRIGEEFDGIVTNVTSFGLFVELQDVFVEGLVHVTALKNDYYHFNPLSRRLQGERTGVTYHLGDKIRVRVVRVDLEDRKIDFELVETDKKITKTKAKTKAKTKTKTKTKTMPSKVKSKKTKRKRNIY